MNILIKLLFGVTTIFLILVMLLEFFGKITFGNGLGDLFYLIISFVVLITVMLTYIGTKKVDFNRHKMQGVLISIGLVFILFIFVLLLSVCRGSEHKWDGTIFLTK